MQQLHLYLPEAMARRARLQAKARHRTVPTFLAGTVQLARVVGPKIEASEFD